MRNPNLPVLIVIAASILLSTLVGCQKSNVLCRRETALLRAEILDLEDKYYALQSQHQSMIAGQPAAAGSFAHSSVGSGVIVGSSPVVIEGTSLAPGSVVQGDIIYDGSVISEGEIIYDSGPVTSGQVIYGDGTTLPVAPEAYYPESNTIPGVLPFDPGGLPISPESQSVDPGSLPIDPGPQGSSTRGSSTRTPIYNAPGDSVFDLDLPAIQSGYQPPSNQRVPTSLMIDGTRTKGINLDSAEGDDGLELMIQSNDENGEFVLPLSALSVTVSEPSGKEVGKWTFVPDELSLFVSRDERDDNNGILLHLPWLDNVPDGTSVIVKAQTLDQANSISDVAAVSIQNKTSQPVTSIPNVRASGWSGSAPIIRRPASSSRSTSIERPTWKPVR